MFRLHNLITYPTPWSRVLFEKPIVPHLAKKFPAFYGMRSFITAITTARRLCLSWARLIQSMSLSRFFQLRFNIIPPSITKSSKWFLLPWDFLTIPCMHLSSPPYLLHAPPISFFLIWYLEQCLLRGANKEASDRAVFCALPSSLSGPNVKLFTVESKGLDLLYLLPYFHLNLSRPNAAVRTRQLMDDSLGSLLSCSIFSPQPSISPSSGAI